MVYGKVNKPPIGANRFPGWETMARPARFDLTKGKGKGKSTTPPPDKGRGKGKSNAPPDKGRGKGKSNAPPDKGKGKGKDKGKKSDRDETQSREDKASKPDPKGPNMAPETWKDRDYEDIPIVQGACPSDHHVAAYVQGVSRDSYLQSFLDYLNGYHAKSASGLTK